MHGWKECMNLLPVVSSESTYRFHSVESCKMCAAPARDASVIGRRLNGPQGLRPTRRVGITTTVARCGRCGLVFCNPMPVPLEVSQHYDTPPEEYWRAEYFHAADGYFDAQIDRFFSLWQAGGKPKALDIGAGVGKAMASLSRRGFDVYGLEPSQAFHSRALERGVERDRLQLSTMEDARFPAGHFDFVSFGAVLEHLYDPAAAIELALRWTAPGGIIHLEVPSARWLTARLANLAYRLQGLDYCSNVSPMHVPYHLYEFTPACFEHHARRAGYEVAGRRYFVGRTFMPRLLDAVGARIMRATNTGMQLEVWLRKGTAG
jgi:SAM-dependent methyltransferase